MVVRKSEIALIVDCAYQETKGDGARKLKLHTSHLYSGLSRNIIQNKLNVMKQPQKLRPLFQNKAPLRPIKACRVQERHQIDLVNMASMPASIDGDNYKYILSVIDIFSRFVFLRPLQTKESSEVAEHLLDIYNEHGPPEILQSDQGTEFKGVVKAICEALNVRIINSAAYSPQTQGKDERSHRTWKEKIKFDIINCENDLNWVENLPEYQKLYNESPHSSLGFLTPFEVYFGRPATDKKITIS
jgi:transposase InsO family protein